MEPVHWEKDPRKKAEKIYCALCKSCEWHKGTNSCIYSGPFMGLDIRPTKEVENEHD